MDEANITAQEDNKAPPDISEKHWARFTALGDRIKFVKEKHKRREELIQKRKDLKISRKLKSADNNEAKEMDSSKSTSGELSWSDIHPYININEHLVQTTGTNRGPRSGLEKKIDNAIQSHNVDKAVALNDQLVARNFAKQVTDACDAKRYLDKKKAEEELKHHSKKRRPAWGFEQKHRWETKGNM